MKKSYTPALGLSFAVIVAACGGSATTDLGGVASLEDTTTVVEEVVASDAEELEAPANPEDAFILFNRCMADAGFPVEQPLEFDNLEGIDIDPAQLESELTDTDAVSELSSEQAAVERERCQGHLRNSDPLFGVDAAERAELEDEQLRWAACMTDAGFDVPQPDPNNPSAPLSIGPNQIVDPATGQLVPDVEGFINSMEACNEVAASNE